MLISLHIRHSLRANNIYHKCVQSVFKRVTSMPEMKFTFSLLLFLPLRLTALSLPCLCMQVPVLQSNNGAPLVGLVTIACHLVKEAKRLELLGDSAESRAVVQQWLEHRVTKLDGCTKEEMKTILKVKMLMLIFKISKLLLCRVCIL